MATFFLFHGGNYKRGLDDGRLRVPLTKPELDMVFYDPEVPNDTDNSIGTEIDLGQYADLLSGLTVGDELFIGLAPNAALYRGLWMMSFDAISGFQVRLDLVNGEDVLVAFNNGDASGVNPVNTTPLAYDFSQGLGDATCDALDKQALGWGGYKEFRNDAALAYQPIAPDLFAGLGDTMYFRITIVALGNFGSGGGDTCCSDCGKPQYPVFQVGAIYDRFCADKQRVRNFCNCGNLCGCSEPAHAEKGGKEAKAAEAKEAEAKAAEAKK